MNEIWISFLIVCWGRGCKKCVWRAFPAGSLLLMYYCQLVSHVSCFVFACSGIGNLFFPPILTPLWCINTVMLIITWQCGPRPPIHCPALLFSPLPAGRKRGALNISHCLLSTLLSEKWEVQAAAVVLAGCLTRGNEVSRTPHQFLILSWDLTAPLSWENSQKIPRGWQIFQR